MFVTATGGPGTAGTTLAASYAAALDARILEHFDVVFFDQRGTGASSGLECPQATVQYYRSDFRARTPEEETRLVQNAQSYAEACIREMETRRPGAADLLPYLGTNQAVEDLETFRQLVGDETFWLYGESYGTQFAQTYAAAHPERLAGLILDGVVDLTLSGVEFLRQQTQAFDAVLTATLEACNDDESCADDFDGDARQVYRALADRLAEGPLPFDFPLPSGGAARREFTLSDLETATVNYLYDEVSRMLLLRALAASTRDDLVPLARILYDALSLDPQTLQPIPDPTYSDAAYYAVECQDYAYAAEDYVRAGDAIDAELPYLSGVFYGDLPCAFWPGAEDTPDRPAPLIAEGVPTLVLGATADPVTPYANGVNVYSRLADGYLITMEGGPHVIFGRGDACPDDLVTAFLVDGAPPASRETQCPGVVAEDYAPLAPRDAALFADPLEALTSAETEIVYLPEYYYWDGANPVSVGCLFGGTLSFHSEEDTVDHFAFDRCAFSAGFVMTGVGAYDWERGRFTLDVAVAGLADGRLAYASAWDGSARVVGEYAGEEIDLAQ